MQFYRSHVLVCAGTGCTSSGSAVLFDEFEQRLKDAGIENEVKVVKTGCFGLCAEGPIVVVYPEGAMYCRVTKADVQEIVTEHLVKGRIVKRRWSLQRRRWRKRMSRKANSSKNRCA